ncbi:MAG TPA: 3-methylcrotonyl-CoA carboxylase, partial [Acidimicrobiaceae bacterium]|nr:3-methylcrotonyl-CoA carboxylase [Acidimicrobiaceae bacterium]
MRILIANRGEIARRIIRTAHRLGHETVAVYAEPDVDAPFVGEATMAVAIGPASLADSYLSGERILAAAAASGATAVHPGYGFLAENATFAQSCIDQDLIWIGPHPQAIASMGSKIEARAIAERAGVPTIPGWSESQDSGELAQAATQIGFPVLVKASAGGGGKGIRIAHDSTEFANALSEASAEAQHAFGDGSVIVERYVQRP